MKTNKTLIAASAIAMIAGAASADVVFDYSQGNQGQGIMMGDGSWYSNGSESAKVTTVFAGNGQEYAMGSSLPADQCPVQVEGETESSCYWGWNDASGITDESFKAKCYINSYGTSESGWGYGNAGLMYQLMGTNAENAQPVNVGATVTVTFKAAAGKTVQVMGKDRTGEYGENEGIAKFKATGSGAWQTVSVPTATWKSSWAPNNINASSVYYIALEYEEAAGTKGQACTGCPLVADLEWKSLEIAGTYAGGTPGAVSKVASAKQVGFAALRNGLQFSNVGAATLNVQIFNTLGKVVASSKVSAKNSFVSTEALSNGVYVVRATDGAKLNMMRNVTIMR